MPFSNANRFNTFNGILFVALFALSAKYIAGFPVIRHLQISPLIVGIVLGVFYANSLRSHLPEAWVPGIIFSSKTLLRAAIIFYGFRITFQNFNDVALFLIIVTGFISFNFILANIVRTINGFGTFALTKARSILGMEMNLKNFKGFRLLPINLSGPIYVMLQFGGFFLTKFTITLL